LGDARLRTFGPPPWLLGAVVAGAVVVTGVVMGALVLAARVAWRALGIDDEDDDGESFADLMTPRCSPRMIVVPPRAGDQDEDGELAG
jgi:hypothetical protein